MVHALSQLQTELHSLDEPPLPPDPPEARDEQKQAPPYDLYAWSDQVHTEAELEEMYGEYDCLDTEAQQAVLMHTKALADYKAHNLIVRQGNTSFSGRH
jgi:hypothetical protein